MNNNCYACPFEDECPQNYYCGNLAVDENSSDEDIDRYIEANRYEYRNAWFYYASEDAE